MRGCLFIYIHTPPFPPSHTLRPHSRSHFASLTVLTVSDIRSLPLILLTPRSHFASLSTLTALRSLTLTRVAPKVLPTLAAMTQLTLLDIGCISMNQR